MAHLYFDESIHDKPGFIIGACVCAEVDLTPAVHAVWSSLGLDPKTFEYKSSTPKAGNPDAQEHRQRIHSLLGESRLALTVCPAVDRKALGSHALALVEQLCRRDCIGPAPHVLYLDESIEVSRQDRDAARAKGIEVRVNQDSRLVGGLQLADHAAHALSGMLLEEMGFTAKFVRAGEHSGYDPDLMLELGFELWASLRYIFITGPNNASLDDDQLVFATFPMEGFGLYIAPSSSEQLRAHSISRFGNNYLGCIH